MISIYDNSYESKESEKFMLYEGEALKRSCVFLLFNSAINNKDSIIDSKGENTKATQIIESYKAKVNEVKGYLDAEDDDSTGVKLMDLLSTVCQKYTNSCKFCMSTAINNLAYLKIAHRELSDYFVFDQNTNVGQLDNFIGKLDNVSKKQLSFQQLRKVSRTVVNSSEKRENEDGKRQIIGKPVDVIDYEEFIPIKQITENWDVIIRFIERCTAHITYNKLTRDRKNIHDVPKEKKDETFETTLFEFICYCWMSDKLANTNVTATLGESGHRVTRSDDIYKGYYTSVKDINNLRDLGFDITPYEAITTGKPKNLLGESQAESIKKYMHDEYKAENNISKARFLSECDYKSLMRNFYWLLTICLKEQKINIFNQIERDELLTLDLVKQITGITEPNNNTIQTLRDYLTPQMFSDNYSQNTTLQEWFNKDRVVDVLHIRNLYTIPDYMYILGDKTRLQGYNSSLDVACNVNRSTRIVKNIDNIKILKLLKGQSKPDSAISQLYATQKNRIEAFVRASAGSEASNTPEIRDAISLFTDNNSSMNIESILYQQPFSQVPDTFYHDLYEDVDILCKNEKIQKLLKNCSDVLAWTEVVQRGSKRLYDFSLWYMRKYINNYYKKIHQITTFSEWNTGIDFRDKADLMMRELKMVPQRLTDSKYNISILKYQSGLARFDRTDSKLLGAELNQTIPWTNNVDPSIENGIKKLGIRKFENNNVPALVSNNVKHMELPSRLYIVQISGLLSGMISGTKNQSRFVSTNLLYDHINRRLAVPIILTDSINNRYINEDIANQLRKNHNLVEELYLNNALLVALKL